jgi:L-malate glycosyltransferase
MVNSLETGGSERQFVSLTQALNRERFRLHLGCVFRSGRLANNFDQIPEFHLGGSLFGWQSVKSRIRLAAHVRLQNIQIAHAFDFYTNILLAPTARAAGIPIVIGSHRQIGDLLTKARFVAQTFAFQCCDRVICNSRAAANALVEGGLSQHRIVVIGNGLPRSAFCKSEPALPRRAGLLRVGMIARMNHAYKGHEEFLRMAAGIAPKFADLEFVLVGDGPLRQTFENLTQDLGIRGRVRFLGDRRDINEILASLDVTVLTSRSESLSNVILESMAAGVPVVANRVGGNVELLEGGRGLLVPEGDEQALVAGVRSLLFNSDLRASIAQKAREFAAANHTLQAMADRHEHLYEELLEEKGFKLKARPLAAPKRIKLAIVAPSLRYVGGQSVQAQLFVRNWARDANVEASLIPVDPELPAGLAWIERIPVLRTVFRQPLYLWILISRLAEADVVHIFSASYWSFRLAPLPAWFFSKLRGKPALINYHSGEARDHLQRFPEAAKVLRNADKVVVPSPYLMNVFREFGIEADIVSNIADLSQFSFRLRDPLAPKLVCTRGFHQYYAIDVVVRAFAEIRQQIPDATLTLVGKGPTEGEVRQLVKSLGVQGITFAGVASRATIGQYYDRADIFINASILDNMPVSIIEAFASGNAVASTCPEGMQYLVEHERTGLLSKVGDVRALAQNVLRLLREPGLAESLALNAHDESKRYTWEVVRDRWLHTYRELIAGAA